MYMATADVESAIIVVELDLLPTTFDVDIDDDGDIDIDDTNGGNTPGGPCCNEFGGNGGCPGIRFGGGGCGIPDELITELADDTGGIGIGGGAPGGNLAPGGKPCGGRIGGAFGGRIAANAAGGTKALLALNAAAINRTFSLCLRPLQ
ncbi:hypothetical protein DERP_009341 [Dermatophagoides pteronyssinus]|uniref:Uncharacterized protein n=1 Tax=Dermatophagoides pteronyssinus TaxID=6956 RepID=A0ABQ8IU97_DERPT|nr:hypothetical protein DERP_009341 [Dermatophagoides pteronyssinus]